MAHREDIRAFLESLEVSGIVMDWGCGSKPVQKYVKCEPMTTFVTIDKNPLVEPDLLADIQRPLAEVNQFNHKARYALCMEVLEHTTNPAGVLRNIYNYLEDGGTLYLSVPFLYPEHGDEDYLRFTSQGLKWFAENAGFNVREIRDITDGYIMLASK